MSLPSPTTPGTRRGTPYAARSRDGAPYASRSERIRCSRPVRTEFWPASDDAGDAATAESLDTSVAVSVFATATDEGTLLSAVLAAGFVLATTGTAEPAPPRDIRPIPMPITSTAAMPAAGRSQRVRRATPMGTTVRLRTLSIRSHIGSRGVSGGWL